MATVIVVGGGINGVTSAIELKRRGHKVILVDPGPLPHPLAASTDISKAVPSLQLSSNTPNRWALNYANTPSSLRWLKAIVASKALFWKIDIRSTETQ